MSPLPKSRVATAVNKRIAANLRATRLAKNVAQMALADAIGVTFQQVQKYESGVNRVSAPTLFLIAQALDEPVQNFFAGA